MLRILGCAMTRTPASRRAYRRALAAEAPQTPKDAPGTPNDGDGGFPCTRCNARLLSDSERSQVREGECVFCEDRYYSDRDDDAGDRAYDAAVQRGEA